MLRAVRIVLRMFREAFEGKLTYIRLPPRGQKPQTPAASIPCLSSRARQAQRLGRGVVVVQGGKGGSGIKLARRDS